MVKYLTKKKSGIILIIFAIMVSACDADGANKLPSFDALRSANNDGSNVYRQLLSITKFRSIYCRSFPNQANTNS